MEKRGILEAGDLEEALKTATAIGDDRLQKEATGRVVPDSFTHGTSLQRLNWFKKGFKSGNPNVCNTWQADKLEPSTFSSAFRVRRPSDRGPDLFSGRWARREGDSKNGSLRHCKCFAVWLCGTRSVKAR